MTAKHTPGPWLHNWSGFDFEITETSGTCVTDLINREDPEETEANARLIAAAPELLELAYEVQHRIDAAKAEYANGRTSYAYSGMTAWLGLELATNAAIKKAEGR